MAAKAKVGRNDRCPCGSGKKYKNCCQDKRASKMSPVQWAAVAAIVAAAGVLVVLLFNATQGGGMAVPGSGICPPGQVWDPTHGHCH
jgi:hypothetical protein